MLSTKGFPTLWPAQCDWPLAWVKIAIFVLFSSDDDASTRVPLHTKPTRHRFQRLRVSSVVKKPPLNIESREQNLTNAERPVGAERTFSSLERINVNLTFAGDRVEAEMTIVFPLSSPQICGKLERFRMFSRDQGRSCGVASSFSVCTLLLGRRRLLDGKGKSLYRVQSGHWCVVLRGY
jgi:hypothetical protein